MTNEQYLDTQNKVLLVGAAVEQLNLDGMLEAIAQAEAFAPILDPTLYCDGMEPMHMIKRLAESMQAVQVRQRELRRVVEQRRRRTAAQGAGL